MSRRRGGHAVYAILLDLPRRDFRYAEVTEERIEVQACPNLVAFDPTLAPLPLGDDGMFLLELLGRLTKSFFGFPHKPAFDLPRSVKYQSSANDFACGSSSSSVLARYWRPLNDAEHCQSELFSRL
jgi:hypothetical protein